MKKIKQKKLKINKIEHVLEEFCSKEKKFYTEPYNIEEFVESLGFQLIPKEMPFEDNSILKVDLSADVVAVDDCDVTIKSNKVIIYNSDNKPEDIHYIIAHALSHYIWALSEQKEDSEPLKIDEKYIYQDTKEDINREYKYNSLAMCILIPKIDFYYDLSDIKQTKSYETAARKDVEKLAAKYKISYPLLIMRLDSFKMK